ncbi:DUF6166 domain-containing protein [Streptomyces sp. NPDC102364]|uniref:DUF6166 domain-containing protein n=1 Tax=Streptomyces sp. NPDC102364 TaxID=3366161 RepID=UPI00381FD726
MAYEDRTYHGIQTSPESLPPAGEQGDRPRIFVEKPEFGPTERLLGVTVLRELAQPPKGRGFSWGYNGSGPSAAAGAILADALDLGDVEKSGIGFMSPVQDDVLLQLREDFCEDVLSQLWPQWRLRRGIILRWSLTWYVQRGIDDLPAALQELPPLQSQT